MSIALIQRSFSSGEVAPALYGRVDVNKYQAGLRTAYNGYVMRHGGFTNRAGSKFIAEVSDSTKRVKLIPFVYSISQSYCLEFGDEYMRVIKGDSHIYDLTLTITGITNANPAVLTYTGTDPSNGDEVYISGVIGAMANNINGRNFKVANVNGGANTFELVGMDGNNFNSTSIGAYSSGGTAQRVYEISTPYAEADLQDLRYTQSADVMTIVHQNYAPRDLSRTADDSWTLSEITFIPSVTRPTAVAFGSGGAGATTQRYAVTAIDPETREESLKGLQASTTVSGITLSGTNPVSITTSGAHGYTTADQIFFNGVGGTVELNGNEYYITVTGATTFTLNDTDSSDFTAWTAGGNAFRTHTTNASVAAPSTSTPHTITWTQVSGVTEYSVYRAQNGVFGYIGTATAGTFTDTGITPDMSEVPPAARNPFNTEYPATVSYYQQRKVYGNLESKPEYVYASKIGSFNNFSVSTPVQDDDAVTFNLVGNRVNRVRSIIGLQRMIVFTEASVHVVNGNEAGVLTPSGINPNVVSTSGASNIEPLVVGNSALYVQARGSAVRDLINDLTEGQKGTELSIISAHLVDGYQITDWAYQEIPHSLIWMVRDDGVLLSLTYVRDQQIVGWARHEFYGGTAENVCGIPDQTEDRIYVVVNRTINGRTVRYIERMQSRQLFAADLIDSVFCDSSLSYDGRHTGSTTMTLSGGTNWTASETLTLTASASTFASTDVGNQIHLTGSDGTLIRFSINAYTSATVVTGKAHKTVPLAMRSVAIATWAMAVDQVAGLWHLEGEDVSVFADTFVESSPFNQSYETRTVEDGVLTLSQPYAVIHVGLPYHTDLETLDIDNQQGETIASKKMLVSRITAQLEKSRGLFFGVKEPTGSDMLEGLQELKLRENEGYDEPNDLLTGKADAMIQGEWNNHGRVFIRQVDPLPMTILSIIPEGLFPIKGGK